MEIILITPNSKYQSLIPSTKIIQSTTVDIVNIIQTQVFLNHHYNISFYCIKNNFPYQFHCPLKISKQLLDRNQGAVELYISNGMYFKIESDTDTLQILSNVQNSLQGVESQHNVVFTLHFWEIQIKMYILNQVLQEKRIKQTISNIQSNQHNHQTINNMLNTTSSTSSTNSYKHKNTIQQISKIILYIDDNNYEQFLNWTEKSSQHSDYKMNEKLSKQYMLLKQQIDNQKNSFRNKIKMVQAILGENINIDKLLHEQKEQNQEYKRLRQTFQTIKNIDNVLIDQQRKLEQRTSEFKQKRQEKHRLHYQNAKIFAAKKKEIAGLNREIQLLKYKVDCVSKEKNQYFQKRSFQMNNVQIKNILNNQAEKCKGLLKNMGNKHKNQQKEQHDMVNKSKIVQSIHKASKKQAENYHNLLKKQVLETNKQRQEVNSVKIREKIAEDMKKYEIVLKQLSRFYEKNVEIIAEIALHTENNSNSKVLPSISNSIHNSPKSSIKTPTHSRALSTKQPFQSSQASKKPLWPKQQFTVLNQLLQKKSQYQSYLSQLKSNQNQNVIVASNSSINQKFANQQERRASRVSRLSQMEKSNFYKNSVAKISQKKVGSVNGNINVNGNVNVNGEGKSGNQKGLVKKKIGEKFGENRSLMFNG